MDNQNNAGKCPVMHGGNTAVGSDNMDLSLIHISEPTRPY